MQAALVGEGAGIDRDRAAGQQPAVDRLHHRAAREHLDAVDQGLVRRPLAEVDRDLPVAVGRGRERLHHRLVLAPRRRHDVEVRQHLRAVDAHVELPLTRIAVRRLGEVQPHRVARPRRQVPQRVAERRTPIAYHSGTSDRPPAAPGCSPPRCRSRPTCVAGANRR